MANRRKKPHEKNRRRKKKDRLLKAGSSAAAAVASPIDVYHEKFVTALGNISRTLDTTVLPVIEALTVKLLFVLESQFSKLPEGDVNKFLVTTLPKLTNELLGFIGCLRHGSAWGSLHHTRAIIEIAAMVNHINVSPAKRGRRLAKYAEFTDFVRCQFFLGLTPDSDGSISEAAAARGLPPPTTAEVSLWWKRIETWRSLYVTAKRPDLSQVRYWHAPASLEQLVRDLGSDDTWWSNYERLCHGTHVSPLGYRLVVQGNPMLVGFRRDQPHVLLALQGLTIAFARCIVEFDKLLEEKLIEALEPEASALLHAARTERERLKS